MKAVKKLEPIPDATPEVFLADPFAITADMRRDYDGLTPDQLARAAKRLPAPRDGDEAFGVIPESLQKLWALANEYERRSSITLHTAAFDTDDDMVQKRLKVEAARWSNMEDVTRRLAWLHLNQWAGPKASEGGGAIGLRAGWVLVDMPKENVPPQLLPQPRAALLPFNPSMIHGLFERLFESVANRASDEDPDDDEQPKAQPKKKAKRKVQ